MSNDPFAEPTRLRSDTSSGPARPASGKRSRWRPRTAHRREHELLAVPKTGTNPLVAAASPVLAAVIRIASDRGRDPDVDQLRRAMVAAMRRFETDALATGLDTRSLRAARYALCATVDDMVLSTPWGSTSSWVQQSMTSIFHNEVIGGERFYDILEQMQKDLGHHEPVVELMYLCMSLGFVGRYRVMPRGVAALTELRDGVYRTIRQRRGDFERELSPQWRGIAAGSCGRCRGACRYGRSALATAGPAAAIMYVIFTFLLASVSEVAFAELFALPPRGQITVPRQALPPTACWHRCYRRLQSAPPAAPTRSAKLRQFLEPEIKAGLVQVLQDAQTITVRLTNRNMFGSGEANARRLVYAAARSHRRRAERRSRATSSSTATPTTSRSDTARFPSNFELSQARADAVAALLRA